MRLHDFLAKKHKQGWTNYRIAKEIGISFQLFLYYIKRGSVSEKAALEIYNRFGVVLERYQFTSSEDRLNEILKRIDKNRDRAVDKLEKIVYEKLGR